MGKPMMIVHLDKSETPAYADALHLINVEHDLNWQWFWRDGEDREYAIAIIWNPERKDVDFKVGRIGEPHSVIPTDVQDRADAAVEAFMASLHRYNERQMQERAAPIFIADAVEGREGWVLDSDGQGAARRVQLDLYVAFVSGHDGAWDVRGYQTVHDKGAPRIEHREFKDLADALDYADAWLDSLPLDPRLR